MKPWLCLGLYILLSSDCLARNLNITQVCEKFTNVATHVQNMSCFIHDRSKFATWDQAAGICKNLKTNLPYGYSSRVAWFPSVATYVNAMKSFSAQGMLPYDLTWIGIRKRSNSYTRYDMYWSSDALTPVTPFNWPEANSYVAFSLDTDHCVTATQLHNVDVLATLEDLPCAVPRPYICEITSDPTPMKQYNPQSCIDHCEAIGGLQYGKSCFLVPKRGDLTYLVNHDYATQQCQGLGSGVVYGSVSRLAHFDEPSWNFVNAHLQGNPWAPESMWIGMRIPASSNKPAWIQADGSSRAADWTALTSFSPSIYDRYGMVSKSDGQWQLQYNSPLYRYICEIVCSNLPHPVNSEKIEFTPASRLQNSTVATICKADYYRSHYNDPKCVSDFGQLFWNDILPKCQRFTCDFDDNFDQDKMIVTYKGANPFPLGTVASYRCVKSLRAHAGQLEITERKCQLIPGWNFTEWAGPLMMCSSEPCPALQIEHGSVSYSDDQRRHGSRVVSVECEAGHVPFQQDSICTDGRWLPEPVCKGTRNWLCPSAKSLDGIFYTSSSCYWITDTKDNWMDSHNVCASEGGRLAAMPASDLWYYYANTFMINPLTTKSTFWINGRSFNFHNVEYSDGITEFRTSIFVPEPLPIYGYTCFMIDAQKNTTELVWCYLQHNALCVKDTYFSRFQLINEQCFNTVSTHTTTESSDRACGMRCRTVDHCQSFTYRLSTKHCQLHQEKPFDFLDKMTNSTDCITGYMIG